MSQSNTTPLAFNTIAIHSHQAPDSQFGAVIPPIYQTTTFAQPDAGVLTGGYDYARCGNPTRAALEGALAELEGTQLTGHVAGLAFASGVGALSTLCMALLKPGDHLLVGDDVYGGTYRFLTKVFQHYGVDVSFIAMSDAASVERHIRPNTKLIYLETPSNPLLKLVDLDSVIGLAQSKGITTCVDNTFASPYLQNPFVYGADIILHSTTKYIGGHSDVIGGALIVNKDAELAERLRFHQKTIGATPDPFASWLTLRGLKTLGVRMERHCSNALALAHWLEQHPLVEQVVYPGLPSHPQHELAKRQMPKGFGGMMGLRVKGGEAEARTLIKTTKLFTLAESLGGVESLIEHPATMTHASLEKPVREAIGIHDNLVRISVGIEDVADLQADLEQALQAACRSMATV